MFNYCVNYQLSKDTLNSIMIDNQNIPKDICNIITSYCLVDICDLYKDVTKTIQKSKYQSSLYTFDNESIL